MKSFLKDKNSGVRAKVARLLWLPIPAGLTQLGSFSLVSEGKMSSWGFLLATAIEKVSI